MEISGNDLVFGESAEVAYVRESTFTAGLLSMGVKPGTYISCIRKAPFGDAKYVRVGRQIIALRSKELALIQVKKCN